MRFSISHQLTYTYDSPVRLSTQYLRLTPRDTARQKVLEWKVETPALAMRTTDGYGNLLHVLTLDRPVAEIAIRATGSVETSGAVDEPSDFTGTPLPPALFLRPTDLTRADGKLIALAGKIRDLRELAATLGRHGGPDAAADSVHAFIACCRHLAVPARYVSGYVHRAKRARGTAADPIAMHAWAEAWIDGRWRSFDIARNEPIGESHIKIAIGADYLDACPIRGVRVGGGSEKLIAQAQVETGNQ
jgi:transglutaminase-like putative cysteine protease